MSACVLVSWAPEATEKSTRIPTPTNRLNSARGSDHIILCPIGLAPRHHESPEVFANSGESGPTRPVNQFQVGLSDVRTLMHTRLYWLDGIVVTQKLLKRKFALPAGQVALVEQRKNRPAPCGAQLDLFRRRGAILSIAN